MKQSEIEEGKVYLCKNNCLRKVLEMNYYHVGIWVNGVTGSAVKFEELTPKQGNRFDQGIGKIKTVKKKSFADFAIEEFK